MLESVLLITEKGVFEKIILIQKTTFAYFTNLSKGSAFLLNQFIFISYKTKYSVLKVFYFPL